MLDPFVYKSDRLRILFGRGAIDKIAAEVERLKMSRVMMLCSHGRVAFAQSVAARLGPRAVGICNAARPGMPSAAFDEIVAELARLSADGFVCLGGGSPIGLAKAVAAQTKIPFIAVVTTYSGSEMAPRWYIGSGGSERTGQTADALAASGMNAMAHAVESLYGPDANPIVLAMAEEAVRRLGSAFPRLKTDARNID